MVSLSLFDVPARHLTELLCDGSMVQLALLIHLGAEERLEPPGGLARLLEPLGCAGAVVIDVVPERFKMKACTPQCESVVTVSGLRSQVSV